MSAVLESIFVAENPLEKANEFLRSPRLTQVAVVQLEGWAAGVRRSREMAFTALYSHIVHIKRFDQKVNKDPVKKYQFQGVKTGTIQRPFVSAIDSRMLVCR